MKGKGGNWTIEELNAFLKNPKGFVPGTTMGFAGLPRGSERADVIAYLNSKSDSPAPLPKAAEAPAGTRSSKARRPARFAWHRGCARATILRAAIRGGRLNNDTVRCLLKHRKTDIIHEISCPGADDVGSRSVKLSRRTFLRSGAVALATPADRTVGSASMDGVARADEKPWRHGLSLFGDLKYPAGFKHFERQSEGAEGRRGAPRRARHVRQFQYRDVAA